MSNKPVDIEMLWVLIEKSKRGKVYCEPVEQFENLVTLLSDMPKEVVDVLEDLWRSQTKIVTESPNFDSLHVGRGGILNEGDDGFYIDFGNWFVAQGVNFIELFLERGPKVVYDYIKDHNIDEDDLTYECMIYAFNEAGKRRDKYEINITPKNLDKLIEAAQSEFIVCGLMLDNVLVGYKVVYRKSRIVAKKKASWSFDIPLSDTTELQREVLRSSAKTSFSLVLSGDLYVTRPEIEEGVHSISLEGRPKEIGQIVYGIHQARNR
jgi:hypothetical protein